MSLYTDPLRGYTYPYSYASPPRYLLSTLEPQRLLLENESLRKRNLALEATLHTLPSSESIAEASLRTEIDKLRALCQARLQEVEQWKSLALPTGPGSEEVKSMLKDAESRVKEALDKQVNERVDVWKAEVLRLSEENRELQQRIRELNSELEITKREGWSRAEGVSLDWHKKLDVLVREAELKERAITEKELKLKQLEIEDLRAQVEYFRKCLLDRDQEMRNYRDEKGKIFVGDENRVKADLQALKRDQDILAGDLALGNFDLRQRMRDLETRLDDNRFPVERVRQLPGTTLNYEYPPLYELPLKAPREPSEYDLARTRMSQYVFK